MQACIFWLAVQFRAFNGIHMPLQLWYTFPYSCLACLHPKYYAGGQDSEHSQHGFSGRGMGRVTREHGPGALGHTTSELRTVLKEVWPISPNISPPEGRAGWTQPTIRKVSATKGAIKVKHKSSTKHANPVMQHRRQMVTHNNIKHMAIQFPVHHHPIFTPSMHNS